MTAAETTLNYQTLRLARHRERLALLEKQVEHCTIRAPHDGFVIYANNADRQVFIEPGMSVRQRQQLFFLPDLSQMEVVAMIHESIVEQVNPSMRAHVQVEGDRRPPDRGPYHVDLADDHVQLANGRQVFRGNRQARQRIRTASSRA